MDKTVLVEHDIEEGERLLRALDGVGFPVVGAMWFYMPDEGTWRYFVASPLVDKEGPRETYARIESVRGNTSPAIDISLGNITAVGPTDPLIAELRLFAGTPGRPYVGGVGLRKTPLGDIYVDDSYIYRMERIIGVSETIELLFAIPSSEKHKWKMRKGKITTKDGFTIKVEIENYNLRQSVSRNGVNTILYVFQDVTSKDGKTFGDVYRWRILDGRLRTMEQVATETEIVE